MLDNILGFPVVADESVKTSEWVVGHYHEPSGEECTVGYHFDSVDAPCQRCKHCKEMIRPQDMMTACPAFHA